MKNNERIEAFYTAFSKGDVQGMLACYHPDVIFQDPVFGKLKGKRAFKMWEFLLSKKKASTKINFGGVQADDICGKAHWVASYNYGDKNRKVVNNVIAAFRFKEGKIIEHIDTFNLWTWTRQALGMSGYLLGWTSFMKKKILKTTNKRLDTFIKNNPSLTN